MEEIQVVRVVEILSLSPARINGEPFLILRIRPDPENSFESTNIAVSVSQVRERLQVELSELLKTSTYLDV